MTPVLVALVMASVALTGLGVADAAGGNGRPCRDLPRFAPSAPGAHAAVPGPAGVGPRITVPVSVHFMKTTDRRFAGQNDLPQVFGPSVIAGLFAPAGSSPTGVNAIWLQANLQLTLHRVEECDYDPITFEGEAPRRDQIPSPMAGIFGEQLFTKINSAFNLPGARSLDLYLWMDIKGGLTGYGASHRASGPERVGAVWVDRSCVTSLGPARCTRLVAHEIGHFLGLCHSCDTPLTRPGSPCTVCLPGETTPTPSCGETPPDFLMRATYEGTALTECEITQARTRADERVNPR